MNEQTETPTQKLTDTELLDGLNRLLNDLGVMMRTCRSGVKLVLGFEGTPHVEFFGGEFAGEVGWGRDEHGMASGTEMAGPSSKGLNHCGDNVRAVIAKAIEFDRRMQTDAAFKERTQAAIKGATTKARGGEA